MSVACQVPNFPSDSPEALGAQTGCEWMARCGGLSSAWTERCVAQHRQELRDEGAPSLTDAEAAGRVTIDRAALALCLSMYAGAACTLLGSQDIDCTKSKWLTGRVKLGESCRGHAECAVGLACEDLRCVAAPHVGQRCLNRCDADSICDGGSCLKRAVAGGACESSTQCGYSLACVGKQCADPPGLGAACEVRVSGLSCALGLSCDGHFCRATTIGDGCTSELSGLYDCGRSLSCVAQQCNVPRTLGVSCSVGDCFAPLACVNGVCTDQQAIYAQTSLAFCGVRLDCGGQP